jgi:hypothetical protein
MSGTQINDLLSKDNQLNNEENSMVDSIINELNNSSGDGNQSTQQTMPQLSKEEKEMLLQQQQNEQRQLQQQQMEQMQQQQQMQQQMQQQQMLQQQQQQQQQVMVPDQSNIDKIKELMYQYKEVLIVLFITFIFNMDSMNESFKFREYPILYDAVSNKSTLVSLFFKSLVISVLFLLMKTFIE